MMGKLFISSELHSWSNTVFTLINLYLFLSKTLSTLMDLCHLLSNHTAHYSPWWICLIFCPIIQHSIHTNESVSFSVQSYNTLFKLMDVYPFLSNHTTHYSHWWICLIFVPVMQHIIHTDGSVSFSVQLYNTLFTVMDLSHFLSNHTTHYSHWWICLISNDQNTIHAND